MVTGLATLTGCAGLSFVRSQSTNGHSSNPITVSISPTSAAIPSGGSLQFSSTVVGTSQTSVVWSASAGSISASGMLKAPSVASASTLTVTATSTADNSSQASAIVTVAGVGPTITTTSLTPGTVGVAYNTGVSASGGAPPYEWSMVSGALPSGIRLGARNGILNGTPTLAGTFSFAVKLTDVNGNTADQNLTLLVSPDLTAAECSAPDYLCARTDSAVIPLGALPDWGGLTGAGTIFSDPTFNSTYPPVYERVSDANTGSQAFPGDPSQQYAGFSVGAGSGDDAHFNIDDSLFTFTGPGSYLYVFGLVPATMQTGLVWASSNWINTIWSQLNRNYLYSAGTGGSFWKLDFTGCSLGGPTCSPSSTSMYSFSSNCGENYAEFWVNAGVGGSDRWFAFASGSQDTDNHVYAYDATNQICYFLNTRFGTVHSFSGAQTIDKGSVTCDGTTAVTGTNFATDNLWTGLNIFLTPTAGGVGTFYEVAAVKDSTAATLVPSCPTGTYTYQLIAPTAFIGSVSNGENYSVHDIRMDPGGTWLIIEEGSYCYDSTGMTPRSTCNVIHAWQLGTATETSCPWIAGQADDSGCSGHYTENADGWVNDAEIGNSNNPSMQFRSWANISSADTFYGSHIFQLNTGNVTSSCPGVAGAHESNKNDPLGAHGYPILASNYCAEAAPGVISVPYSNEILGWSQSSGSVLRFGHTYNSALENHNSQFTAWIAVGSASATGNFFLFTTDGEGTLGNKSGTSGCSVTDANCRSDVFILNLTPPAN